MTPTDPALSGWSVIEHAPPGPVALTVEQREEVRAEMVKLRQRVDDLKLALGDDAGWFDRAQAAERQRDEARAELTKAHHNAVDCTNAVAQAAREQSPNETDEHIVATTVAGSTFLTDELMRVARERDEARAELFRRPTWTPCRDAKEPKP
jgi:hypothetical protein